jgi:transglutaminase-like putative cysteine protease
MNFKVLHVTTYLYSEAVSVCHNQVHLNPRDHRWQTCFKSRVFVRPVPPRISRRPDHFGNWSSFFSVEEGHEKLTVTAVSKVQVLPRQQPNAAPTLAWDALRAALAADRTPPGLEAYELTFDSPFVPVRRDLVEYAEASFPRGRPVLEGVLDLSTRIHSEFAYDPKATQLSTPVDQVLANRRGVCQDFAHLMIGCLRSLGLPARYVSGYLLTQPAPGRTRMVGADASHAWVSAYCPPEGWVDIDPTNNRIPSEEHITLAWGRDYSDVCPIKGVCIGGGKHRMMVAVDVTPY